MASVEPVGPGDVEALSNALLLGTALSEAEAQKLTSGDAEKVATCEVARGVDVMVTLTLLQAEAVLEAEGPTLSESEALVHDVADGLADGDLLDSREAVAGSLGAADAEGELAPLGEGE